MISNADVKTMLARIFPWSKPVAYRWGEECPPETSDWDIFADLPGKERQGGGGIGAEKENLKKPERLKTENSRAAFE